MTLHGGEAPAGDGAADDKVVGTVTSAAWSTELGAWVALGYLHRSVEAPGPVRVRSGDGVGGSRPARAALLPLTPDRPAPSQAEGRGNVPHRCPQRNRTAAGTGTGWHAAHAARCRPQRPTPWSPRPRRAFSAAGRSAHGAADRRPGGPRRRALAAPRRGRSTLAPGGAAHPWRAWVVLFARSWSWELAEYAARGSRADHPDPQLHARCGGPLLRPQGRRVLPLAVARCGHRARGARPPADAPCPARGSRRELSALSYAVWALLGLATLAALVPFPYAPGSSLARPAVVLARLATGPFLRVALVLGWMWAGWHLFAR